MLDVSFPCPPEEEDLEWKDVAMGSVNKKLAICTTSPPGFELPSRGLLPVARGRWHASIVVNWPGAVEKYRSIDWELSLNRDLVYKYGPDDDESAFEQSWKGFYQRYEDQWVRLSFGILDVDSDNSQVEYQLDGNPSWGNSIRVLEFKLSPCGPKWEIDRLLTLCLLGKANDNAEACLLQNLPPDVLTYIRQMISTATC